MPPPAQPSSSARALPARGAGAPALTKAPRRSADGWASAASSECARTAAAAQRQSNSDTFSWHRPSTDIDCMQQPVTRFASESLNAAQALAIGLHRQMPSLFCPNLIRALLLFFISKSEMGTRKSKLSRVKLELERTKNMLYRCHDGLNSVFGGNLLLQFLQLLPEGVNLIVCRLWCLVGPVPATQAAFGPNIMAPAARDCNETCRK